MPEARFAGFDDPTRLHAAGQNQSGEDKVMTHKFGVERDPLAAIVGQLVGADLFRVGDEPRGEALVLLRPLELAVEAIRCPGRDGSGGRDQQNRSSKVLLVFRVGDREPGSAASLVRPKANGRALGDEAEYPEDFASQDDAPRSGRGTRHII